VQIVLCAGAPTRRRSWPRSKVSCATSSARDGVVWIDEFLQRDELCAILTSATTFVCPSVYEPLGIVNLEAMACGAAVVGTATGGIPEVVVDGVTGRLVPIEQVQDGTGTPSIPTASSRTSRPCSPRSSPTPSARAYGAAGRERAATAFSWRRSPTPRRRSTARCGVPIGWGHAPGARIRRCRRPPQRSQHHRSRIDWTSPTTSAGWSSGPTAPARRPSCSWRRR
jgi:hypothetical protein